MALELDHVFICCSEGAPEGDVLVQRGLREGSPNVHSGQGTANRRFFFQNSFLELIWVSNSVEACSAEVARTRLWDRWRLRAEGASPFGLVFRPRGNQAATAPFATWAYRPKYLPAELAIEMADGTPLTEPGLVYLPFAHRSGPLRGEPTDHAIPIRQICGVTVTVPAGATLSPPSQAAQSAGLANYCFGAEHLLELKFLADLEFVFDFRPDLPLVLNGERNHD